MNFKPLVTALAVALSAGCAQAQAVNLNLAGASPGGLWSLVGVGLDRVAKAADPASVVTYQSTGGGFANIGLLSSHRVDLGLAHDAEATVALAGTAPFREPIENLRAIGYLYNWAPMHFFLDRGVAEQYGIDSLDDIATSGAPLRIGINRPGNITSDLALFMLAEAGVTEEALAANGGQLVRAGSSEQAELMQDGRLDMITNGIFVLHSSFRAVDENSDVVLLQVPEAVIDATNARYGTGRMIIPGGSYSNQPNDVASSALGALLLTHDQLSDEVAHTITAALIEHLDEMRAVHSSMADLTVELLATPSVIPFHPGAAAAYREAGLLAE